MTLPRTDLPPFLSLPVLAYACALSACLPVSGTSQSLNPILAVPLTLPSPLQWGRASVICLAVIAGVLLLTATEPAAAEED